MPFKVWAVGEETLAADFNAYVQTQVIPRFSSAAQRTSQWAAPPTGALSWRDDGTGLEMFYGGVWGAVRFANLSVIGDIRGTGTGLLLRDLNNSAQIGVGVAAGLGTATAGTVALEADNANNVWNNLPLALNHRTGAGTVGIGLGSFAGGFAHSILANAGGLHVRNSQDTAYSSISASAFPVNCSAVHKANPQPVEGAVEAVEAIKPIAYEDRRHDDLTRIGFTAEDVRATLPRIVYGEGSEATVDPLGLIGVLWQAVKDLTVEVHSLRSAVAS